MFVPPLLFSTGTCVNQVLFQCVCADLVAGAAGRLTVG